VVFLIFSWLLLWNVSKSDTAPYKFILWIFPYLAVLIILSFFTHYKPVRILHSILWLPGIALIAAGPFMQILWSFIYTYLMILGGTVILVFLIPKFFFHYSVEFAAGVYVVLTIASILATTFSEKIIKSVHSAQNREYSQFSERVSLKLFGQSNVRFAIFVFYFILLIVFNFSNLNKTPLLKQEHIDTAVLQSFATYVAFDRIISNWNAMKKQVPKATPSPNGA
jgi:hypothetical protein